MALASTSLRVPGAGGASAARCAAGSIPPWRRWRTTFGGQVAERVGGALDLGDAGEEGEQRAVMLGRARGGSRRPFAARSAAAGVAAFVDQGQRMALALAFDPRRIAEQPGEALAVERRRHGEDAQVGAQRRRRVERERERRGRCRGCAHGPRRTAPPRRRRARDRPGAAARNTPWVMAMTRVALPTLLSRRVA